MRVTVLNSAAELKEMCAKEVDIITVLQSFAKTLVLLATTCLLKDTPPVLFTALEQSAQASEAAAMWNERLVQHTHQRETC